MRTPIFKSAKRARDPAPPDEEIIELWLSQFSGATQQWYQSDIDRFQTFVTQPLSRITPREIHDFFASIKGSPATRSRALAAVKSLYRFAVLYGFLASNPASPVKGPKVFRLLGERYLTESEVQEMLLHEPHPRNKLIIETLYIIGLRVSELCDLTWSDVDGGDDCKTPKATITGKGGRKRCVVFPQALWKRIKVLRSEEHPYIFSSSRGGRLDRSQVMRIVQAAAKRAGIEKKVSPHWLRHAHATHAIANGAPLHVVQQSLGHSSLSVTGLYLHTHPNDSSSLYLKKGGESS